MKYKLKEENGKVAFLLRTGDEYSRNKMPLVNAEHFIKSVLDSKGKVERSQFADYPIAVNDKFFFAGEIEKGKTKKCTTQNMCDTV